MPRRKRATVTRATRPAHRGKRQSTARHSGHEGRRTSPGRADSDVRLRPRVTDCPPRRDLIVPQRRRIHVSRDRAPSSDPTPTGGVAMVCVLDVHKRSVVALVVDHGQKEKVRRRRAGKTSVEGFLRTLPAGTPVIMEGCYAWEDVYDLAGQLGLAPLVAHPG